MSASSCMLFGFLALSGARRAPVSRPNGPNIWYCSYTSAIQTKSGTSIHADLRVYSPSGGPVYPNDTVAFVVAKAAFANNTCTLDALHLQPYGGDPTSDSYDDNIPDFPFPIIVSVGRVISHNRNEPKDKCFSFTCAEYVRGDLRSSTLRATMSGPRWSNSHLPATRSVVFLSGVCGSIDTNVLELEIDSITFNIGTPPDSGPAGGGGGGDGSPPGKRKKFQAHASAAPAVVSAVAYAEPSMTIDVNAQPPNPPVGSSQPLASSSSLRIEDIPVDANAMNTTVEPSEVSSSPLPTLSPSPTPADLVMAPPIPPPTPTPASSTRQKGKQKEKKR